MIEYLNRLMRGHPDGIPVKILSVTGRRWRDSHLLAADTTGAAFRSASGVQFVPWTALQGVVVISHENGAEAGKFDNNNIDD